MRATLEDYYKQGMLTAAEYYEYLVAEQKAGRVKEFTMQDTFILQDKFLIVDGKRIDGSDKNFKKYQKQQTLRLKNF
mgnify:CR=1 FL=1